MGIPARVSAVCAFVNDERPFSTRRSFKVVCDLDELDGQCLQQGSDVSLPPEIKQGGGLVSDDHSWRCCQHACDGEQLPLSLA